MLELLLFALVLIISFGYVVTDGTKGNVTIRLMEFNQRESETQCHYGLLARMDRLVLHADMTFPPEFIDNISIQVISLEMKDNRNSDRAYQILQEVQLSMCLNKPNLYMRCELITKEWYKIKIKLLAEERMSKANIKIVVSHDNTRQESNVIQLPLVFDPVKSNMYLNEQRLHSNQNEVELTKCSRIIFCCEIESPASTKAVILRNGIEVTAASERCVTYEERTPKDSPIFKLLCDYCNSSKRESKTVFSISNLENPVNSSKIESKTSLPITSQDSGNQGDTDKYFITVIAICVSFTTIILAIVLYLIVHRLKMKRRHANHKSMESVAVDLVKTKISEQGKNPLLSRTVSIESNGVVKTYTSSESLTVKV